MTERGAAEVTDYVEYLRSDPEHQEMRKRAQARYKLLAQKLPELLPDHYTRGNEMAIRYPTLASLQKKVLSNVAAFRTLATVAPFANSDESRSDSLEQWLNLFLARLNEGRRLDNEIRQHLTVSPFTVLQVRCGDPDSDCPWTFGVLNPMTCFMPVQQGPYRPAVMAREYEMTVRDLQKITALRGGKQRKWDSSKGAWAGSEPISLEVAVDGPSSGGRSQGQFERVKVREFDDGENIYVCAYGRDTQSKAEMLAVYPNLVGGCSYLVASGFSSVNPEDLGGTLQPLFLDVMQLVMHCNEMQTMVAFDALNNQPHVILNPTPEQLAVLHDGGEISLGLGKMLEQQGMGPNFLAMPGEAKLWQPNPNPNLIKLLEMTQTALAAEVNRWSIIGDPQVLGTIAVNVWLPYLEDQQRALSPLLGVEDWLLTEACKMVLYSVGKPPYDRDYSFMAKGGELYSKGEMKRGAKPTLSGASIKDFEYQLNVETESITPSQQREMIQQAEYLLSIGAGTFDAVLKASGVIDLTAMRKKLAAEALQDTTTGPIIQQAASQRLPLKILLKYGEKLPEPQMAGSAPVGPSSASSTAPPPTSPSSGLTVNTPAIAPATGGSQPVGVGR